MDPSLDVDSEAYRVSNHFLFEVLSVFTRLSKFLWKQVNFGFLYADKKKLYSQSGYTFVIFAK